MIRTQIYLTAEEKGRLEELAERTGHSQSELIRRAIDQYLADYREDVRAGRLENAFGIWRDRTDLPDFSRVRDELDRK